jgi:hypothetical protein
VFSGTVKEKVSVFRFQDGLTPETRNHFEIGHLKPCRDTRNLKEKYDEI